MSRSLPLLALLFVVVYLLPASGHAASAPKQVKGQILIRPKSPFTLEKDSASGKYKINGFSKATEILGNLPVKSAYQKHGIIALNLDPSATSSALIQFKNDPGIQVAQPNYIYNIASFPNDPYFSPSISTNPFYYFQWNLVRINLPRAWDMIPSRGSRSVRVAVIDTGVAFEDYLDGTNQYRQAPELTQVAFSDPASFLSYDCDTGNPLPQQEVTNHPNDMEGHGTHITAIISQNTDNSVHSAGIAPNITVVPIRSLSCPGGTGSTLDIISGMMYAMEKGARVINLSFGGEEYDLLLRQAVQVVTAGNVVVVAPTGNWGEIYTEVPLACPACFPETIAVGASRWDNARASYSQFHPYTRQDPVFGDINGRGVDLIAPGGQVLDDNWNILDANFDRMPDGILQQTIIKGNPTEFTYVTDLELGRYCLTSDGSELSEICGLKIGTSIASPHVTGVIALMLSADPDLTPDQIKSILTQTAEKFSIPAYNTLEHGSGILDAAAALGSIIPDTSPTDSQCIPGDANCNGKVDGQDYLIWVGNYGQNLTGREFGDFNNNGIVNGQDYLIWVGNYGL